MPTKWVSTMSQVHKYQGVNGPSYDTVSEAFPDPEADVGASMVFVRTEAC